MQLSALRESVKYRAGVDTNDGMAADAVVTEFVNGAIRQITMMKDWDWNYASETITTVANTASYNRAAACRKTDRVVDIADGAVLQQISKKAAARYVEGTSFPTTSLPRFWYVEGGQLVLVPTPRTVRTYKHHYVAAETTLSADSSTPAIPDWAIDVVIVKAAKILAARMGNTAEFNLLREEEKALVDVLQDEAKRSRGPAILDSRRDWHLS